MPCAFCGLPFDKAAGRDRSEEHAWAKRLAQYLPHADVPYRHTVRTPKGEVFSEWTNETLDVVARRVCVKCNTGWMERLEDEVDRFLGSLVKGNGRTLYDHGQTLLATWSVKTALALNLATPQAGAMPTAHYRQLAKRQVRPPDHCVVWLGAYEGPHPAHVASKHLTLTEASGNKVDGYLSTFWIGRAVFQVFGHVHDEPVTITKRGARADMASQIWPVEGPVRFPPKLIVTNASFEFFISIFPEA